MRDDCDMDLITMREQSIQLIAKNDTLAYPNDISIIHLLYQSHKSNRQIVTNLFSLTRKKIGLLKKIASNSVNRDPSIEEMRYSVDKLLVYVDKINNIEHDWQKFTKNLKSKTKKYGKDLKGYKKIYISERNTERKNSGARYSYISRNAAAHLRFSGYKQKEVNKLVKLCDKEKTKLKHD
jgi:hypothetical protein